MKLSEIDPSQNVKLLLYADSGAGKTCFAASFPTPMLFLDFDGKVGSAARFHKGEYVLKLEGGMLVFEMSHDSKGAMVNSSVRIRMDYFLDKLAEAIPGTIDDVVIELIKGALK